MACKTSTEWLSPLVWPACPQVVAILIDCVNGDSQKFKGGLGPACFSGANVTSNSLQTVV